MNAKDFAISVGATCVEPSVPVTDKAFEYRSAAHTDVRLTWLRFQGQLVELADESIAEVITALSSEDLP